MVELEEPSELPVPLVLVLLLSPVMSLLLFALLSSLALLPLLLVLLLLLVPVPVSAEAEDVPVSWWRKTRPSAAVVPAATMPMPPTIAAAARLPRVRMSIGAPLSS
ncbi:MAG TPA: hypothetical protein VGC45_00685 [Gryllotalpicola sp.]